MSTIHWINSSEENHTDAQLAIVSRPRGNDWLQTEIESLKSQGVNVLVSFLEAHEQSELGLTSEGIVAQGAGIEYRNFPIPDRQVPDSFVETQTFIQELTQLLSEGKSIGIHCRQSVGRAGFMAAAILVEGGTDVGEAFAAVENARGCPVPDTDEQRQWVARYATFKDMAFVF